jgi:cytochrome oxidase Cu insertion factor (SCO1/SenC/PrrC family)
LASLLAFATLPDGATDQLVCPGREAPAGIGGELDLVDHHGERFALSRVAGRPALLFFGYTHCGTTCPQALGTAREVIRTLAADQDVAVLFVTLDPLNDGPNELREFVQRLDPRIVGLTGTPRQIERVAEAYGVGLRGQGATLEHSSMFYLLDASARVRRVYVHTTPATVLVDDIRRMRQAPFLAALGSPRGGSVGLGRPGTD